MITIKFETSRPLRISYKGKHFPKMTKCIIEIDEKVIAIGEVVLHTKDTDNKKYAKLYASKKAFKNAGNVIPLELRTKLWKDILTL